MPDATLPESALDHWACQRQGGPYISAVRSFIICAQGQGPRVHSLRPISK
jgi:hypothetical protein